MKIGLSAAPLLYPGTGIATYTENLALALAHLRPGDEFFLLSNKEFSWDERLPSNLKILICPSLISSPTLWLMTRSAAWAKKLSLDLFHFTNNGFVPLSMPCPHVVTIHDTTPYFLTQCHPWRRRQMARFWWSKAAKRAAAVIAPSDSSARDALRHLGVNKAAVIAEAAASYFQRNGRAPSWFSDILSRHRISLPFILNTAVWEPRKNQARLLAAFARARALGDFPHQLVFAGSRGWGPQLALSASIDNRVRFLGKISRQDLTGLYQMADFFVYPSLYEGFGLPNLEAMAAGAPVITSDNSAMAEVAGGAALCIEPTNVQALALAILNLAKDSVLKENLRQKGFERSRLFSWDQTAKKTWLVYEEALAKGACR